MRILVADDNRDAAQTLATILRLWGHKVEIAFDGPSALTLARHFEPEVALLDIQMPHLNGGDVAFRIRRQSYGKRIAIMAVTATDAHDQCVAQYNGLFDAYLPKPCDLDRLEQLLFKVACSCFRAGEARSAGSESTAIPESATGNLGNVAVAFQ
jgi:DNA-binding response OmpR family regulator